MSKETDNRLEELLEAILNDSGTVDLEKDWDNLNRLEQYLICIITKSGIERMKAPLNRLEVLLQAIYNKNI